MNNRTKIICTIGPASQSPAVLERMIRGGMDCVRLNFSHGTYEQFENIIKTVRALSSKLNRPIAIIQDLQGPKIRLGKLAEAGITVKTGQHITLSIKNEKNTIPIQYQGLPHEVRNGDIILVSDGMIELKVVSINKTKTNITCRVVVGGPLKSHKGINVPTASLSAKALTAKDRADLAFGIKHDVDFVALSFVKDPRDILQLRRLLKAKKSNVQIIAKLERHEAMKQLPGIIRASDAIMVARGDLGIEVPAEQVPLLQKKIIHLCNTYSKPVIVATEMLTSMIENPRATRAEVSDAANAIFDHADALMLSNETAVGRFPVEAVRTLRKVAGAVENDLKKHRELLPIRRPEEMPLTNATCLNATKLAHDINAKYIVAVTRSGYTAREIAKYRSYIPIIVFSSDSQVARHMSLVWGVEFCFVQWIKLGNPLPQIRETLLKDGLVRPKDEIVVCNAGFGKKEKLITTTMI